MNYLFDLTQGLNNRYPGLQL